MPRQVVSTVYKFEELSDSAKEKARESLRDINVQHEWWDFVYEDAKNIGEILGIDMNFNGKNPCIWFSGFWSQGDGACFEGHYSYAKRSCQKIREYAPKDEELHRIADQLFDIQKRYFYRVTASCRHSGHYQHSRCMTVDVECLDAQGYSIQSFDCEQEVRDLLRCFADWIYCQLRDSNEFLISDEAVEETIIANEYEFNVDGSGF